MSFPIILYSQSSPTNQVTKELGSPVSSIEGKLRDVCSITDPVILVQTNDMNMWPLNVNYMYIEAFNRYYYITNMVSVHTNLWELHGHVDVLMSYADQIRQQTAIVSRQESKYNLMLDDGFFMSYQNPIIITRRFSVEAPFETQEFVLVVAGGG